MEALIYDESPIAEYIQADAFPYEDAECTKATPSKFAPRGFPRFKDRLRQIRNTASSVTEVSDQRILERFRYIIVASQLLSDDPKPRPRLIPEQNGVTDVFNLKGALLAATLPFAIAFLLHLIHRQRNYSLPIEWYKVFIYILFLTASVVALSLLGRHQYLKLVRQSALAKLSILVNESHNFDSAAGAALRYIQEVEVVARGYNINSPLPPISRFDDTPDLMRCRTLRSKFGPVLSSSISQYAYLHNNIQSFVSSQELESYHDIYDVSLKEYAEAVFLANNFSTDAQSSLKELRFLFRLHMVARKVFFCDLLALRRGSTWFKIQQWRIISQYLQALIDENLRNTKDLTEAIAKEEYREHGSEASSEVNGVLFDENNANTTPSKTHSKAQIRRFDAVANGVRSLNAKIHLIRDELHDLQATENTEKEITATLARHYEQLGNDLRSLVVEWERGRNTMFLTVDSGRPYSRSSSGIRSPVSPSPSLGGLTMVEGGPTDALKLLNGEDEPHRKNSNGIPDEEVFEAVALPRKRMSLALTREEKIAKLQEKERKRATLQEQADSTTNMLRELQMVIKHRPQSRMNHRPTSLEPT